MDETVMADRDRDIESDHWISDTCSFPADLDESEFNVDSRAESVKFFARRPEENQSNSFFSSQHLQETLNAKKIFRTSTLSHIELNPERNNELLLITDRSNLRSRFGYDVGKNAHLYPEEALYLLECGKAEIYCNHVSLSVQRARSLLLIPHKDGKKCNGNFQHATHDEYLVFKCLTKMGYCLYRSKSNGCTQTEELKEMDLDDDVMIEGQEGAINTTEVDKKGVIKLQEKIDITSSAHRKNLKRKFTSLDKLYENEGDSSDDSMEEIQEGQSNAYVPNSGVGFFATEPSAYTVDEADSDVEIVDEVIFSHGGVEIQEIAHTVGCPEDLMEMSDEPVPSTSKGPQVSEVVVDLVSSEDENEDSVEFGKDVWEKFIPNTKVFFKVPPSKLIPESIPGCDNVYEFDLKDKSDISDLELEYLVDEVTLNDEKNGMYSPDSPHSINLTGVKSWKEWRQNIFQEARNVMNNSLLSSSDYINGEAATEKLFLWDEAQNECSTSTSLLNKIVFEMYGPAAHGYSRQKAFTGSPIYYVLISRQDESVPDFGLFGSNINGTPILIAVVCDSGENDVLFMTADRSPLNSLF